VEPIPRYRFERIVRDAIDLIPDEFGPVLDNVAIVIEDRSIEEPDLLGLFDGVPITERNDMDSPSIVTIFRDTLCEAVDNERDLVNEVAITVIHELAHAAGIDDERLDELGWS
jgi:predicted Zn-dependent protease with MMP-like domain